VTVVIDYAHTPLAFENILKLLNTAKNTGQKLTVVFGCGGERDVLKRPKMGKIAENLADRIIITEDNSRGESFNKIRDDILEGIKNKDKCTVIEERETAIRHAIRTSIDGEIVAIIGKGHERYITNQDGLRYFNEPEIVRDELHSRGDRHES
jgi:UDP-N-acetylmuramoyl-L-alanyl-D-glutamate--2,6-diaminopimelate ligase